MQQKNAIVKQLKEVSEMTLNPNKAIIQSALRKSSLLQKTVVMFGEYENTVNPQLKAVRVQISHRKSNTDPFPRGHSFYLKCTNNMSLTWVEAFDNVIAAPNKQFSTGLSCEDIIKCGRLLETTDSIPIVDLLTSIGQYVPVVVQNEYCKILSKWFPVMTVSCGGKTLMINIHELYLNPDTFCDLLMLSKDINTVDTEHIPEEDHTAIQPKTNKKHAGGRPSKHKQFPAIVNEALSFIRLTRICCK